MWGKCLWTQEVPSASPGFLLYLSDQNIPKLVVSDQGACEGASQQVPLGQTSRGAPYTPGKEARKSIALPGWCGAAVSVGPQT